MTRISFALPATREDNIYPTQPVLGFRVDTYSMKYLTLSIREVTSFLTFILYELVLVQITLKSTLFALNFIKIHTDALEVFIKISVYS